MKRKVKEVSGKEMEEKSEVEWKLTKERGQRGSQSCPDTAEGEDELKSELLLR